MAGLPDSEDELNIRNTVALQQKQMNEATNCHLSQQPIFTKQWKWGWGLVDSKFGISRQNNNTNSPKKNVSANRFSELSIMDIDVEVSQTVNDYQQQHRSQR